MIKKTWTSFKDYIDNKQMQWQFEEFQSNYKLIGVQGPWDYECNIVKDGGANQIDFETNYKNNSTNIIKVDSKTVTVKGSGSISSLNGEVKIDVNGLSTITIVAAGTYDAVLFIQGSQDNGTTWFSLTGISDSSGNITNNFGGFGLNLNGTTCFNCAGLTNIKIIASVYNSGTALLSWSAGIGTRIQRVFSTYPGALQASIGGAVIENTPQNITEGLYATCRITPARALHTNLRDNKGNEIYPELILNTVTATALGDTTIIAAPGAGLSIFLKRFDLSTTSTSTINPSLREGVGGTIKKKWLTTNAFNFTNQSGWKLPANTSLVLNLAVAVSSGVQMNVEYFIGV